MANVHADYALMEDTIRVINDGKSDIDGILAKLKTRAEELVENGFQTEKASRAFADTYREVDSSLKEAIGDLSEMGKYLTEAKRVLSQADLDLSTNIRKQ